MSCSVLAWLTFSLISIHDPKLPRPALWNTYYTQWAAPDNSTCFGLARMHPAPHNTRLMLHRPAIRHAANVVSSLCFRYPTIFRYLFRLVHYPLTCTTWPCPNFAFCIRLVKDAISSVFFVHTHFRLLCNLFSYLPFDIPTLVVLFRWRFG